jgi:TonB family protein
MEALAGAIALDEATERERDTYRGHLALCARCVESFGGERDIARVMSVVAQARDEESWEPDLRAALRDRTRMRRNAWRLGLGVGAAALAVSLGLHVLAAGTIQPVSLAPAATVAAVGSVFHVTLERRPHPQSVAAHPAAAIAANPRPLVVTHNVVALAAPAAPHVAKPPAVEGGVSQDPAIVAALPPSERQKGSISSMQTQSAAPVYEHQAESIAVSPSRPPVVREVAPLGGRLSLPDPPAIAAHELAEEGLDEATAVFELGVDERGAPTSCSIEKTSGIPAIDESVCRAAMHAHFVPRTVNGKPTPSVYRDAFVFLANER